jgi:3-hydroxy-9,10-secoandrosta-1,3,5(10)-triene-9,17-dione monooxygenase reductase component
MNAGQQAVAAPSPRTASGGGDSVPRTDGPTSADRATRHAAHRVQPDHFRAALGSFASGVTVITALDGLVPVGFTCQAFTSLSLDPPMVSFSVSRESGTRPRIMAAGRFCVNVLAYDQHGLCARFAARTADRFQGVDWWRSPGGSPVLDGVLAWIGCTVEAEYPAGDHTIVLGHVRELATQRTAAPLVFHRGRFASCFPLPGSASAQDPETLPKAG